MVNRLDVCTMLGVAFVLKHRWTKLHLRLQIYRDSFVHPNMRNIFFYKRPIFTKTILTLNNLENKHAQGDNSFIYTN